MLKGIKDQLSGVLSRLGGGYRGPGQSLRRHRADSEEAGQLFYCPACETVYIANEKRTCSTCETPVESVPATVRETERP